MAWARTAYCGVSWLILGALFVQFFFAGLGIFGETTFDAHAAFGFVIGLTVIALLALSHVASWLVRETAILVALVVAQIALAWTQELAPWLAALHPVNALVIAWWTYTLARRSRELRARWPDVAAEPY